MDLEHKSQDIYKVGGLERVTTIVSEGPGLNPGAIGLTMGGGVYSVCIVGNDTSMLLSHST